MQTSNFSIGLYKPILYLNFMVISNHCNHCTVLLIRKEKRKLSNETTEIRVEGNIRHRMSGKAIFGHWRSKRPQDLAQPTPDCQQNVCLTCG